MPTSPTATGMFINSSLAKNEAIRAGYDEALKLTTEGHVAETSGENVFIAAPETVHASGEQGFRSRGRERASLITVARDLGYEVNEQQFRRPPTCTRPMRRSSQAPSPESFRSPRLTTDRSGAGQPGGITAAVTDAFSKLRVARASAMQTGSNTSDEL